MNRYTSIIILLLVGTLVLMVASNNGTTTANVNSYAQTVSSTSAAIPMTLDKLSPTFSQMPDTTPTATPAPYEPTLYISYRDGAPGSIFTLSGLGFIPGEQVIVTINGSFIASIEVQSGRWFSLHLDTAQAEEGLYIIVGQSPSAQDSERFTLDSNEPVRQPLEGTLFIGAPTYLVPAGIAFTNYLFLPVIARQQ
jgi:hypothetical protein